jgi:hypothetical protein
MLPAFVTPDGVVLESVKQIPTPSEEFGTVEETSLGQLCREAAKQAERASTKGKS